MTEIELSAGTIEYVDRGSGPALLLLHGLMMDASLWDGTIENLAADHRLVAPTLPLGAHRHAMRTGADLSLPAVAALVEELMDRLDLRDVTVVGNDTGGALTQLLMVQNTPRLARVALVSCDAFDNFPPGLTGRTLFLAGKLSPRMFRLFVQQMRVKAIRRLPIAFGSLTRRGDAATARWIQPTAHRHDICKDTVAVLRAAAADTTILLRTAPFLTSFSRPALIVWASEDRVMPPEHGQRLAQLLPNGQLTEIADSSTLIPLDQPEQLADLLRQFVSGAVSR